MIRASHFTITPELFNTLRHKYNHSQFAAIKSCLKTEGITLIHGPPGTGKSRTILGVVSAILCCVKQRSAFQPLTKRFKDELLAENQYMVT